MSENNKQNNKEEKEDWLGKLIFWLSIGAVVFGITTFLGYLNERIDFEVTSSNVGFVELSIMLALVVLLTLGGLFGKK